MLNIDWDQWRFDVQIDGELVQTDAPFRGAADSLTRVDLYSRTDEGIVVWYDEIDIH